MHLPSRSLLNRSAFYALVGSLVLLPLLLRAQDHEATAPVHPADLLRCLPPAPKDWTLKVSNAHHLNPSPPMSTATREYYRAPVDNKPAVTVRITIQDLRLHDGLAAAFAKYQVAAGGIPVSIAGMTGTRVNQAGSQKLQLIASNRFQITILETGGTEPPDSWAGQIDLAGLEKAGEQNQTLDLWDGYTFVLEFVDELNPRLSRKTNISYGAENPNPEKHH